MKFSSKSEQSIFNETKGVISELNDGEKFCSVTLLVGHDNSRSVNIAAKKELFDQLKVKHSIGDRVICAHYPVSNKKLDRWHTHLRLLSIAFD